ncbi:MAG: histidine kinase [Terracidiphilus sp.]|jgi:signal transduction histidine kinase
MKLLSLPRRGVPLALLLCLVLALGFVALRAWLHSPSRGLPYRDSFSRNTAEEWKALGGTWELDNGMMRNDSDERGAKLLSGSPYWHNYSIEADIKLLGISGDAGLIIRSRNEEEGVNSYNGYYAGIRTRDNTLVLGRAEHGWIEVTRENPAPGGIRPFQWYHLKLLAYDCQIAAVVTTPSQASSTSLAINDQDCVESGRVGLRSYSSGGIWRNVVVRSATHQDLEEMLRSMGSQRNSAPGNAIAETSQSPSEVPSPEQRKAEARSNANTQSIESLLLSSFATPAIATIRGVVVLTTPLLFVQDSTGGVSIPQPTAPPLKVGDEVEVTGEVHPGDFSSTMEHARVQVLWARTPVPPVSVTASQASTGRYDATFVELQGRLAGKERGPDNTLILDLDEGPQSFRAIMNPGRGDYLFSQLKPDSSLRLRGICVVDPAFTKNLTPFVLLLRSNEDLEVLAGPPWWSTGHVIVLVVVSLLLALVGVSLYHRVEHWRLRAILEERERLAHEMHDTLAQSFAGIGFQLQAIRNGLPDQMSPLNQQLELASNLVRHSHEEARRSIATLRTEDLESQDILAALERSARRMVEGGAVQVVSQREGDQRAIPLRIADTLYRIGQEAIANAVRHAHPSLLTIRLTYSGNSICLQIEDDGAGFVQGSGLPGFGIRGMRRRAQSISAAFQLHSERGEGTQVRVEAPLPPRLTLASWPKLLWQYGKEHWTDGRPARHANSHSYRG